ncbi:MAG TPA: coproporphyrinogen dehydrogenase HemZ [Lachnospiraceae bacterium]|nr:coproporphyrinogen dehydrogenase HemZ [Lachnospiraceae bacterium]
MDIGVRLNKSDFLYDVHSLVKAFFPDDDVSVFTDSDTDRCGAARDILFEAEIPDYVNRKEAKDNLKRTLYETLSDFTGKTLPWGTLSGIRPTKIPTKMLDEGRSPAEITSYMKENYLVSDRKIALALEVAENEKKILQGIPLGADSYSLYLNIPFCPSICLYCTFSSSPVSLWEKRIDEYLDTLIREMKGRAPKPQTIYIGGGTPTALLAQQLEKLLSAVSENCGQPAADGSIAVKDSAQACGTQLPSSADASGFTGKDSAQACGTQADQFFLHGIREFTVEAGRPDSITAEKLAVLKKYGVTRISVNPQTMNQKTLDLIGRKHTVEDTVRAFHLAREAGFDNINMDIILGLPGEDLPEVEHTLEEIEKLSPDSLTIHSLAVKRASRLKKDLREEIEEGKSSDFSHYEGLSFHNSDEIIERAYACARGMGMRPYYLYRQKDMKGGLENTGFAREGKECLYNILIMEELQDIRAFGAGASSKTVSPDGRIERKINPKDVRTYLLRQAGQEA